MVLVLVILAPSLLALCSLYLTYNIIPHIPLFVKGYFKIRHSAQIAIIPLYTMYSTHPPSTIKNRRTHHSTAPHMKSEKLLPCITVKQVASADNVADAKKQAEQSNQSEQRIHTDIKDSHGDYLRLNFYIYYTTLFLICQGVFQIFLGLARLRK